MISDASPPHLTCVLAGEGEQIHLAALSSAAPSGEHPHTLCRQPVTGGVPARKFHRLGCPACSVEAVRQGVTWIEDRQHTTVNLLRFLAARHDGTPAPSTPLP